MGPRLRYLPCLPVSYHQVWPRDLVSASHSHCGVEPVERVAARVRSFVLECEEKHDGCSIVLVSHADTLQVRMRTACPHASEVQPWPLG